MKTADIIHIIATIDVARDLSASVPSFSDFLPFALDKLPPDQRAIADAYLTKREATMDELHSQGMPRPPEETQG